LRRQRRIPTTWSAVAFRCSANAWHMFYHIPSPI
jgi:hypothetical protein